MTQGLFLTVAPTIYFTYNLVNLSKEEGYKHWLHDEVIVDGE